MDEIEIEVEYEDFFVMVKGTMLFFREIMIHDKKYMMI